MYEYNSNGMNEQNAQSTQNAQFQGNFSTEQKPPKKPHKTAKVVALVAAIAVLCGGVGFGGAYLGNTAGRLIMQGAENVRGNADSGNADTSADPAASDGADNSSLAADAQEVLDALSSDAATHNIATGERNSDGSYAYTRDLVSAVKDSVAYVEVYVNYRGQETLYGAGSGVVISKDGYVITNAHVVENDYYTVSKVVININTTDPNEGTSVSTPYTATIVGSDSETDIAVLKIEGSNFQAAKLGDSDELSLGDDVVAIGNPMGLETSVSKGVVSGLNRQVYDDNSVSAIQTDTAINSGNSGGGLFNMYGEIVGIVNMKLVNDNAENLSFAITINDVKSVISDLVTKGYVSGRPILGITCLQISDYLGAVQNMTPGLLVTDIDSSLAISKSDLVVGDTITAINGTEVRTVDEVSTILKDMKPGDTVTATVVRTDSRGREKSVDITIELSEYSGN